MKSLKSLRLFLIILMSVTLPISSMPINPQSGQNIWNLMSSIGTEIDYLAACVPNPIIAQTTITLSGNYCLAQSFTGNILIQAPNTTIDMNGMDITGRITMGAPYSTIKNGTIFAPSSRQNKANREGAVMVQASNITISDCTMMGLTSTDSTFINGSSCIVDDFSDVPTTRDNIVIEKCTLVGGQGYSSASGFSGSGGFGISLNGNNNLISDCFVQGGAGGSSQVNQAGFGSIAFTSQNQGTNMVIRNSTFIGGNSGTGMLQGTAGSGMYNAQSSFLITNCTIQGGTGLDNVSGDGNFGGRGLTLGNGSQGGVVQDSFISGGDGGSTSNNSPDTGGNGGQAIQILGSSAHIKIKNCSILASGDGGDGFNGGDGADGILIIGNLPANVEITHCTICSTGSGGTANGGTIGSSGLAINDENTDFNSIIFSNFAYDIANTSTQYIIRNSGTAVVSTGISAYSTSPIPNFLDNVFVP